MDSIKINELYPYICVYSNVFKDIKKTFACIKKSELIHHKEDTYLNWSKWSIFGTYSYHIGTFDQTENESQHLLDERNIILEIKDIRQEVLNSYIKKYNIKLPESAFIQELITALKYEPNIDSSFASGGDKPSNKSMEYHTDFSIKDIEKPVENFLITCNIYFNDDYDGGEIMFSVGDDVISYKPKAGDVIVFPSGSPIFPGNEPYFHAVKIIKNGNKFFSRNFIKYINKGTEEWFINEKKYGKETWEQMEEDRAAKARPSLNCISIDNNKKIYNPLLDKYYWK
jgi:hypothetical protein